MGFADSTGRFSGRVESYRRHRPAYPPGIVDLLVRECRFGEESFIADVAAGTGLLAEIFLAKGFRVVAVEPNRRLCQACATLTPQFPHLRC